MTLDLEAPLADCREDSHEQGDALATGASAIRASITWGVGVGNFTGAPMWNLSGMSGATPVWLEVMHLAAGQRFERPAVLAAEL